jgi:hypothetical protein
MGLPGAWLEPGAHRLVASAASAKGRSCNRFVRLKGTDGAWREDTLAGIPTKRLSRRIEACHLTSRRKLFILMIVIPCFA